MNRRTWFGVLLVGILSWFLPKESFAEQIVKTRDVYTEPIWGKQGEWVLYKQSGRRIFTVDVSGIKNFDANVFMDRLQEEFRKKKKVT